MHCQSASLPNPHGSAILPGLRPPSEADARSAAAHAARTELKAAHAGARILVAEDNDINQEVVLGLLEAAGLVVELARDGQEAIDMAAVSDYDLILLDVQMPRVDGYEASRAIRRGPRHAIVPILALTACASSDDRSASSAAGMDGHLAKPLDPVVLYGALGRWLETGRHRPRADGAGAARPTSEPTSEAEVRSLSLVEGLDVASGLRFFAGAQCAYLAALRMFAGMYGGGLPIFGSVAALRRELHGAGSACAHVGALALAADARRLEALGTRPDAPVSDGDFLAEGRAFSGRLVDFCDALRRRLYAGTSTRAGAGLPTA